MEASRVTLPYSQCERRNRAAAFIPQLSDWNITCGMEEALLKRARGEEAKQRNTMWKRLHFLTLNSSYLLEPQKLLQ